MLSECRSVRLFAIWLLRGQTAAISLPHGRQEKVQHTLLAHCNVGGVGEVYESSHHLGADVVERDLGGAALLEAAGEHGSEVRAAGGQNHLVHLRNSKGLSDTVTHESLEPSI